MEPTFLDHDQIKQACSDGGKKTYRLTHSNPKAQPSV